MNDLLEKRSAALYRMRHEILRIIRRVTLRNPPFPVSAPTVDSRQVFGEGGHVISTAYRVPDRDRGGAPTVFYFAETIDQPSLERMSEWARAAFLVSWYTRHLRSIFEHEFDEALHVDGVRREDPHIHPGAVYRGGATIRKISRFPGTHRQLLYLDNGRRAPWPPWPG